MMQLHKQTAVFLPQVLYKVKTVVVMSLIRLSSVRVCNVHFLNVVDDVTRPCDKGMVLKCLVAPWFMYDKEFIRFGLKLFKMLELTEAVLKIC